ncbi:Transcriptional regulator, PAS and GerE domains [Sodalis praecaptivus]|uniref:Transcriptional regulator, PAS and GerE domains n=1 Tax=Sodalis praecaptivus TaxID=1239307 RepID=W0HW04_9GAMM|nr:PAS and helix-turn-helix domain-containing protein [Sodalis praecaptivus]AHF76338.1 Transcriptional regulator, PAS and GerE domains [Sodalis praecaptivus]
MVQKSDANRKKLILDSLNTIPLVSFMERCHVPWGIRDSTSHNLYTNQAGMAFLNIPDGFDFAGRSDDECPCPWSELAPEFTAHDRQAETSPAGAEIIATSYYGRDAQLAPYHIIKFPLFDKRGEILGNIWYAQKFKFISLGELHNPIKPSIITLTPPVTLFTEKEHRIIFYAIQKMSVKKIAAKLFVSHRTIENSLCKIYRKVQATSLNGLIEYCHETGLNCYVPKKLLKPGVNFLW